MRSISGSGPRALAAAACAVCAVCTYACRDVARFSSGADHYTGGVVAGNFVRAGIADDMHLCLTLDADHLQDTPGAVTSTDGRFARTPLRPIPQVWHDSLSTMSFGEGRERNLMYVVTPVTGTEPDVMILISLMQSGSVEARLVRGAPGAPNASAAAEAPNLFAVFSLDREPGPCP
jgi:hypothetical protein